MPAAEGSSTASTCPNGVNVIKALPYYLCHGTIDTTECSVDSCEASCPFNFTECENVVLHENSPLQSVMTDLFMTDFQDESTNLLSRLDALYFAAHYALGGPGWCSAGLPWFEGRIYHRKGNLQWPIACPSPASVTFPYSAEVCYCQLHPDEVDPDSCEMPFDYDL
jgi:hypothetical protein